MTKGNIEHLFLLDGYDAEKKSEEKFMYTQPEKLVQPQLQSIL